MGHFRIVTRRDGVFRVNCAGLDHTGHRRAGGASWGARGCARPTSRRGLRKQTRRPDFQTPRIIWSPQPSGRAVSPQRKDSRREEPTVQGGEVFGRIARLATVSSRAKVVLQRARPCAFFQEATGYTLLTAAGKCSPGNRQGVWGGAPYSAPPRGEPTPSGRRSASNRRAARLILFLATERRGRNVKMRVRCGASGIAASRRELPGHPTGISSSAQRLFLRRT